MDAMWTAAGSEDSAAAELRRGPWTVEEDVLLAGYIKAHGEGRWNELARLAGLRRTGKSCRLRWLNYLRPGVRRGDFSPQEQLLILELHFRWGNRWSRIAQELPGRTDNEVKNYWRTRVQKHAKQLRCDVDSRQFQDVMRHLWMPRLAERIHAAARASATTSSASSTTSSEHAAATLHPMYRPNNSLLGPMSDMPSPDTTTTWSTATARPSSGALFPSNQVSMAAAAPGCSADWSAGSASARSDDMFDGSWSELLARACDDGADSLVFPDFGLGESRDNSWSLDDIWSQHQY